MPAGSGAESSSRAHATTPTWAGRVALGAAAFSLADARDDAAAIRTIRAARDAGVSLFDSARAYAPAGDPTHNERLLLRALGTSAEIATKGGHFRVSASEWAVDNSPTRLRSDVESSLRALRTERIPLYYVHRCDGSGSIGEAVMALEALRREGTIGAIGLSNVSVAQLDEARGLAPIAAVQNPHSVQAAESSKMLARCEALGITFFAYSPLGGSGAGRDLARALPRLAERARVRHISVQRLALRALLASSPVLAVASGATRITTAVDAAAAADEEWSADDAEAYAADLADH